MPSTSASTHSGSAFSPEGGSTESMSSPEGNQHIHGASAQFTLPGLEAIPTEGASEEAALPQIGRSPLPVNQHVLRGRSSIRGFVDAASVDRPWEHPEEYQPLDPATIAMNRRWMTAIRAERQAKAQHDEPALPLPTPEFRTDDLVGPPFRELMEEARNISVRSGRTHKLERDASGVWRIIPV